MAGIPSDLPTGLVTGQFLFVSQDQIDFDTNPDLTPVTGEITFTCSATKPLRVADSNLVLVPPKFKGELDGQGNLIPKGGTGIGIEIPASDSLYYNPSRFTWRVEFKLTEVGSKNQVQVEPFDIFVQESTDPNVNSLARLMPLGASGGKPIIKGDPGPQGDPGPPGIADDVTMTDVLLDVDSAFRGELNNTFVQSGELATYGLGAQVTVGRGKGYDFNTDSFASDDKAVQAAVNTLPWSGGIVMIAPGNYDFAQGVDATAKSRLRIDGGFAARIRWKDGNIFANGEAGANYLFALGSFAHISGLHLDGLSTFRCPINGVNTQPLAGTNTLGGGIKITHGRTRIEGVYVANMAEDGISDQGGIGPKLTDVYVINCGGAGIHLTDIVGVVSGNTATDADFTSVWVAACGYGIVCESGALSMTIPHVWGCQKDGLWAKPGAGKIRCAGGHFESNGGWGARLQGVLQSSWVGVDFWANGIAYTPVAQMGGVLLDDSRGNQFVGCQFRENRYHQVLMENSAGNNSFTSNTLSDVLAREMRSNNAAITNTMSGTLTAGSTSFIDANAPIWLTTFSAVGCTLTITGAGASGAILTVQVVAWEQTTLGTYKLTLSAAAGTTITNPVYTVNAVAHGFREGSTGTFTANLYALNVARVGSAALGVFTLQGNTSQVRSSVIGNVGYDSHQMFEGGSLAGAITIDHRNGDYYRATLTGSVTSIALAGGTPYPGRRITITIRQGGSGGYTVSGWPATTRWSSAGAPVFPTAVGASGTVDLIWDGANWLEMSRSL